MPKIATEFCDYERTNDVKRKLNAKLSLLYQNEKIEEINSRLTKAMEIDGEGGVLV
jgi:hypothetical protein